mmetsp:Transcript_15553/g.32860  ORF Transcript_15553/g.32860 Transcript_15553/m.32860 type:complete len:147 (+) Transcript_15553:88-528(+)
MHFPEKGFVFSIVRWGSYARTNHVLPTLSTTLLDPCICASDLCGHENSCSSKLAQSLILHWSWAGSIYKALFFVACSQVLLNFFLDATKSKATTFLSRKSQRARDRFSFLWKRKSSTHGETASSARIVFVDAPHFTPVQCMNSQQS